MRARSGSIALLAATADDPSSRGRRPVPFGRRV